MAKLASHFAGLNVAGPAGDEGGADAAFVNPAFVAAEGSVLGPAPGGTDGGVGADDAGLLGVVATAGFFGAAAVVGEEHDERVVVDF